MSSHSSYYHTCIIYPIEFLGHFIGYNDGPIDDLFFTALDTLSLRLDADFICSPLHKADDNVFKQHFHIVFRLPNKLTANSFESLLSDAINGNFTGIAYHKESACVTKIDRLLRYFIHFDNPNKQQFNSYHDLIIVGNWEKELYNAFSDYILRELIDFVVLQKKGVEYLAINGFGYALTMSKNLYLVNSLIKENDIKYSKKRSNYYD